LTGFARTSRQADGAFLLSPMDEEIETEEAMAILGVPWSTLRRIIDLEAIQARKRSQARWTLSLKSVLDLKTKTQNDPEFWQSVKAAETVIQRDLNLA
jgi:hypothetical protein